MEEYGQSLDIDDFEVPIMQPSDESQSLHEYSLFCTDRKNKKHQVEGVKFQGSQMNHSDQSWQQISQSKVKKTVKLKVLTDKVQPNKQNGKISAMPSFQQVQQSIQVLKIVVPELFPDQLAKQIHKLSYSRLSTHKHTTNCKIDSFSPEGHQSLTELQNNSDNPSFDSQNGLGSKDIRKITKQDTSQQDSALSEEQMYELAKIAASIFVAKDKNEDHFYEQVAALKLSPQQDFRDLISYKDLLEGILRDAYKKLQTFLIQDCNLHKARLIQKHGETQVIGMLMSSNRLLEEGERQTLQDIVIGQWGLGVITVTEERAEKLFGAVEKLLSSSKLKRQQPESNLKREAKPIMERSNKSLVAPQAENDPFLKKKQSKLFSLPARGSEPIRHLNDVRKLNRIWNNQYQLEMIHTYKRFRSISIVQEHFQNTFQHETQTFCAMALSSKLNKILRYSIRKFYKLYHKFGRRTLPEIKRLNHHQIKAIIYDREGIGVRLLLLDVYMINGYDEGLMVETIKSINRYLQQMEVTDKHQQNIRSLQKERARHTTV